MTTPAFSLLLEIVSVVSRASAEQRQVQISGNEELLRAVASVSGSNVFGCVNVPEDCEQVPTVTWSASVLLDGVRVNIAVHRAATAKEQRAVPHWDEHTECNRPGAVISRSGWLRHLVEEG